MKMKHLKQTRKMVLKLRNKRLKKTCNIHLLCNGLDAFTVNYLEKNLLILFIFKCNLVAQVT